MLNRADIGNQLLSNFMAAATGIFTHDKHSKDAWYKDIKKPIKYDVSDARSLSRETKLHYIWQYENEWRCDATCWYDCIDSASFPQLGINSGNLNPSNFFGKMNSDHINIAKEILSNYQELFDISNETEESLKDLRAILLNR
jgi:hypothetical protein